jgi:hypothetical protein
MEESKIAELRCGMTTLDICLDMMPDSAQTVAARALSKSMLKLLDIIAQKPANASIAVTALNYDKSLIVAIHKHILEKCKIDPKFVKLDNYVLVINGGNDLMRPLLIFEQNRDNIEAVDCWSIIAFKSKWPCKNNMGIKIDALSDSDRAMLGKIGLEDFFCDFYRDNVFRDQKLFTRRLKITGANMFDMVGASIKSPFAVGEISDIPVPENIREFRQFDLDKFIAVQCSYQMTRQDTASYQVLFPQVLSAYVDHKIINDKNVKPILDLYRDELPERFADFRHKTIGEVANLKHHDNTITREMNRIYDGEIILINSSLVCDRYIDHISQLIAKRRNSVSGKWAMIHTWAECINDIAKHPCGRAENLNELYRINTRVIPLVSNPNGIAQKIAVEISDDLRIVYSCMCVWRLFAIAVYNGAGGNNKACGVPKEIPPIPPVPTENDIRRLMTCNMLLDLPRDALIPTILEKLAITPYECLKLTLDQILDKYAKS